MFHDAVVSSTRTPSRKGATAIQEAKPGRFQRGGGSPPKFAEGARSRAEAAAGPLGA